jgi:hypothetical protein
MLSTKLQQQFNQIHQEFPHLTEENYARIMLLFYGLDNQKQESFPDHFTHYELIFTVPRLSSVPILNLLNPDSPFQLIKVDEHTHALLYEQQFVDYIHDYEQRPFDFRKQEPHYFYVTEINGDLVLKLNPIQLCDFFQNPRGELPCGFCFRNDMVQRFTNLSSQELVNMIWKKEAAKDNCATLKHINEISIVTGSYLTDDDYVKEISALVNGLKPKINKDLRVVVGSHEGKSRQCFEQLQQAGVTVFAFPIESLDDHIRQTEMKNRKGNIPTAEILTSVKHGLDTFGADGAIIRLVAGMGDALDQEFVKKVAEIAQYKDQAPFFNINQYMPFTHYHWRLFQKKRPYSLEYMFKYMDIINQFIPIERQMRFKVSP